MMMPVHELAQLTWEEVRDLDRGQTLVVLPVGAIEAHGPHLPLDTDVVIATAMARAGARKLTDRGHVVLILPALAFTAASFGSAFHGTLSISAITVTAVIVDVARSLSDQGFRLLPIVFPDLTRKPWATRLGDEFRSGACHAGQFETSIVLHERADAVRDEVRQSLAPNPQSLSKAIKAGKRTFEAAGGPRAYFGDPAAATGDEGARLIEALGAILEEAVIAEI